MTVAIRKLIVPRPHRRVSVGQAVNIMAEIVDATLTQVLLDPDVVPTLSLYDPNDVQLLNNVDMIRLSAGLYQRTYQTVPGDDVGFYTGTVTTSDAGESALIYKVGLFNIINAPTLQTWSYVGIFDQTGVLWYWFIGIDNTLWSLPTVPISVLKAVTAITIATTPYWFVINNALGQVRYVYPSISGEPTVTGVQPSVGTGYTGSPTFIGHDGRSYKIIVTIADDIDVEVV